MLKQRTLKSLTRAVGVEDTVLLETHQHDVQAGDLFLLATDGVYEHTDAPCV